MRILYILALSTLNLISTSFAADMSQSSSFDGNFHRMETRGLAKPLFLIVGSKGFIGTDYLDVQACNRNNEACAVVFGTSTYENMEAGEIKGVSSQASKLGIKVGMKVRVALTLLK